MMILTYIIHRHTQFSGFFALAECARPAKHGLKTAICHSLRILKSLTSLKRRLYIYNIYTVVHMRLQLIVYKCCIAFKFTSSKDEFQFCRDLRPLPGNVLYAQHMRPCRTGWTGSWSQN